MPRAFIGFLQYYLLFDWRYLTNIELNRSNGIKIHTVKVFINLLKMYLTGLYILVRKVDLHLKGRGEACNEFLTHYFCIHLKTKSLNPNLFPEYHRNVDKHVNFSTVKLGQWLL